VPASPVHLHRRRALEEHDPRLFLQKKDFYEGPKALTFRQSYSYRVVI
jgi:hypothetical protein